MNNKPKKIAVIGAGAIGGFFGIMLSRTGFDVHYLFRSDYEIVRKKGLILQSKEFGDYELYPVNAYKKASDIPQCDWVIVGTKATENKHIVALVNQVASSNGKVLLLQNGLSVEEEIRSKLRDDLHLLGGLCIVSAHRKGPGVVEHVAYGKVNIGYHSGPLESTGMSADSILEESLNLLSSANIEVNLVEDLSRARWEKLVMNVPFNGLTVLLNSGTLEILKNHETRSLVRDLMEEVVEAASRCGHPLPSTYLEEAWKAADTGTDFKSSMYLDLKNRRPLELDAIYMAPISVAKKVGYSMPRVEMLYKALCLIDERNRQY